MVNILVARKLRGLKTLGIDGVMVYQETYQQEQSLCTASPERKETGLFLAAGNAPDRLGRAGIDKIGLGALIGLSDNWRVDCYMVAGICCGCRNEYWLRVAILFPSARLRPCTGGVEPRICDG